MVKIKIKSDRFNKTKLSAISLVDSVHKIRYSLMDYIGSACAVGCAAESPVYRKTQFYDKKGKPIKYGPPFDSSQKDYFYDYSIEGINDFNMKLKFGSKKHLKSSQIYFGEASSKKVNGNFYFTIFNEFLESNYELYYKDEKIADIEFEVVKEPLKTYNTDWSY
ncbi:hypothetical protein [Lutimonas sp.]|uniref:hypothetical protein n=1 Tax=Lutimonas sp. TaxID=1872403 RepID=UPI003D9BDD55